MFAGGLAVWLPASAQQASQGVEISKQQDGSLFQ